MSAAQAIAENRDTLLRALVATADPELGFTAEEVRQLMVGFLRLMEAGARGDIGPRDEYILSIVPGLQRGGVPVTAAATGVVRMVAAVGAVLGPQHLDWVADFCADYTERLIFAWRYAT